MFKRKRTKVFCIGRNKTGTTSLEKAFTMLGYQVGNQRTAGLLMDDWAKRDFRRIIKYCKTADAFQDVPFSNSYTYQAVDHAFPGSKFVLTIRDSAEQWYESLTRFHTKRNKKDRLPTVDDLQADTYIRKGWMWEQSVLVYGINAETLYNKQIYTNHYKRHNEQVMEYFRFRPQDLLVLNVADQDSMLRLSEFLGVSDSTSLKMPHLNASAT